MRRLTLGLTVLVVVSACQTPTAAPTAPTTPDVRTGPSADGGATEVRRTFLRAPAGMSLKTVEFADAQHGYAALWSDIPQDTSGDPEHFRYASAVFATKDGGRTWARLADPRPPSESPQMYTVDKDTVVLLSEPGGWYVSTDGGATFRFSAPEPAEMERLSRPSRYYLRCVDSCRAYADDERLQPGLPGSLGGVSGYQGNPWAASVDAGAPYTAFSGDQGRTWQRVSVPDPGALLTRVSLHASVDGADLWLAGYPIAGAGGLGRVAPMRRKDLGMPLLWRWIDGRWEPRGTVDRPVASEEPYALAAIGGGQVAITGPHGLALVDEAWHQVELRPRPSFVVSLPDGTIFALEYERGVFYLGTRSTDRVTWVRLELTVTP